MKSLKRYKLTLTTVGPVHIGSGETRTPKEYIRVPKMAPRILWFPDMATLYTDLIRRGMGDEFEYFAQSHSSAPGRSGQQIQGAQRLDEWLNDQRLATDPPDGTDLLKSWGGYGIRLGDFANSRDRYDPRTRSFIRGRQQPLNEIQSFIKDGLRQPYIPGSSLKGLLRTIISEWLILSQEERLGTPLVKAPQDARAKDASDSLESKLFRTLARPDIKSDDAVNDIFQTIRVPDSRPLSLADLMVVQKIDVNTEDSPAGLPLFREVLRPGLNIHFGITVDIRQQAKIGDMKIERLMVELPDIASMVYKAHFGDYINRFGEITSLEHHDAGPYTYFGGGAGYRSKTIVNKQATIADILDRQFNRGSRPVPHIDKTAATGVSPLVLKLAQIGGRYYEMGKCHLAVESLD